METIPLHRTIPPLPLVDVCEVIPSITTDIRYSTNANFMGRILSGYQSSRCWLHEITIPSLKAVQAKLNTLGLGLFIWDGYRPCSASEDMVQWAIDTHQTHLLDGFIAPKSIHNTGCAIDCTLITLRTGESLDMGTDWDTFTEAAATFCATGPILQHRLMLREAMIQGGFEPYNQEWWHFSFPMPYKVYFNVLITE